MHSTSDFWSPLKKQRLEFQESKTSLDDKHRIHRHCNKTNRTFYLYTEKSNGIRVGVGDLVSVAVRSSTDEPNLCFCQVASIWKAFDNAESTDAIVIAGRWLERVQKIKEYMNKATCR